MEQRKPSRLRFLAAILPTLALSLRAQDAALPVVVLKAARVLNVESGALIDPPRVLVVGDRIRAVGEFEVPDGAETIDLGDRTLLPGLIDCHTHLGYDIDGSSFEREVRDTAADTALRGARNARVTLSAGFTTVRDLGCTGFADIALMKAIDRDFVEGPRMIPAGHAISITGGHGDATGFAPGILELGPEAGIVDGVDSCIRAVRYQIKHGAKVIKVCATAGVLSFETSVGAQQLSDEEIAAVVHEASRHGLKVAAHAHGTAGILAAVRAGVASIEHGSMLDDETIAAMKERGTWLVPTAWIADALDTSILPEQVRGKARLVLPLARASLTRAIRSQVPIAFGTDAAVIPHGANAHEFAVYVKCGMSSIDAIRTATINAANLLGTEDRARIKAGLLADLVACPGNPLTDITALQRIDFVMKGGAVFRTPVAAR